jgi:quinol monooxygenase YgiN
MTKLIPNNGQLTLINTYEVKPERDDELIEFLSRATQETLRYIPGFISANLHRSFDGTKIVNYAQWVDAEATAAARQDPKVAERMRQQFQIADSFSPLPFKLRHSVAAAPIKQDIGIGHPGLRSLRFPLAGAAQPPSSRANLTFLTLYCHHACINAVCQDRRNHRHRNRPGRVSPWRSIAYRRRIASAISSEPHHCSSCDPEFG